MKILKELKNGLKFTKEKFSSLCNGTLSSVQKNGSIQLVLLVEYRCWVVVAWRNSKFCWQVGPTHPELERWRQGQRKPPLLSFNTSFFIFFEQTHINLMYSYWRDTHSTLLTLYTLNRHTHTHTHYPLYIILKRHTLLRPIQVFPFL